LTSKVQEQETLQKTSMTNEYNPILIGFSEEKGPLEISLKEARKSYGLMPSRYGFVSAREGRDEKKALNLKAGSFIRDGLKDGNKNLKWDAFNYFNEWHRDYTAEFGIDVSPLINLNDPRRVIQLIFDNKALFKKLLEMNLKAKILAKRLIKKNVLNSVAEEILPGKAAEILSKKIKFFTSEKKERDARYILCCIKGMEIINKIEDLIQGSILTPGESVLTCYADEISRLLLEMPDEIGFSGKTELKGITGSGVEFAYAERNASYFMLGKDTGDCTSDKKNFQADSNIENIFWTVFSWILDLNYQILKVYFNGEFVMKAHLLPLYIPDIGLLGRSAFLPGKSDYMILAVDAVETVRGFRDDISGCREDLIEQKDHIFSKTIEKIEDIARKMQITHIYAEKFSNTRWVREYYERFPEIFIHVNHFEKIDHLEDVFYLARNLCGNAGVDIPDELFMEIQMKNTYLYPQSSNKAPGVKSFTVIKGNPEDGIRMNRVIGI